jgi:hypothetical protein
VEAAGLFAPLCSITRTQRRRYFWAAWWSVAPSREPFAKPDAASGGARTRDEALRAAERAAGRPLVEADGSWARAWARVVAGKPPWPAARESRESSSRSSSSSRSASTASVHRPSAWSILGLDPKASVAEIKAAFRKRALETHPDRGGDARAFDEAKRAFDHALALRAKKRGRAGS